MTAEFQDIENEIENENEQPRDLDILLTLPYSEMTEAEIGIIVDYKVDEIVNAEEFRIFKEATEKDLQNRRDVYEQEAEFSRNLLETLTANAINSYNNESENYG